MPHEPVIEQKITIYALGKVYKAWDLNRRDYGMNHECGGRPIMLRCELANEDAEYFTYPGSRYLCFGIAQLED